MLDPLAYYSPETYLFATIAEGFSKTGQISPEALYLIIDWKAPRARTKHLSRLARIAGGTFTLATQRIAADLYSAVGSEQRLGVLMTKWGFRLPTASALLSVLYPDMFTVYDVRVCRMLGDFDKLGDKNWSAETWREYQRFKVEVQAAAPCGFTLRNCDRWLWGKDKQKTLIAELTSAD